MRRNQSYKRKYYYLKRRGAVSFRNAPLPILSKKKIPVFFKYLICLLVLGLFVEIGIETLQKSSKQYQSFESKQYLDDFRTISITPENINSFIERTKQKNVNGMDVYDYMALSSYYHDFSIVSKDSDETLIKFEKQFQSLVNNEENLNNEQALHDAYEAIFSDLKYFPVAENELNEKYTVSYENSWLASRTYMYDRLHEGCDLMASVNKRNIYPILSVSDGTVEKIGWLTQGGYRIGIRSEHGAYFYYAHLASYAKDYQPGDVVNAGECIGFMGDTGYSNVEGTVGNFDVHLHFGIYIKTSTTNELSVNPYYVLLYLEDKKISYQYPEE